MSVGREFDVVSVRGHRVHRGSDRRVPGRQRAQRVPVGARRAEPGQARGAARPAGRDQPARASRSTCCTPTSPNPSRCGRSRCAAGPWSAPSGPTSQYGEPLVAACAAEGTDYLDLTGEPEFVDLMYLGYHARRRRERGPARALLRVRLNPADLGALLHRAAAAGGRADRRSRATSAARHVLRRHLPLGDHRLLPHAGDGRGRRAAPPAARRGRRAARFAVSRAAPVTSDVGAWALPQPTIDPQVVLRSARALERYGPDFSYGHNVAVRRLPTAVGLVGGVGALVAAAQVPPARRWLLGRMQPGDGPSAERRAKAGSACGSSPRAAGGGSSPRSRGSDPGYGETAKMLAESALCLAFDDVPTTAGQVTHRGSHGGRAASLDTAAGLPSGAGRCHGSIVPAVARLAGGRRAVHR